MVAQPFNGLRIELLQAVKVFGCVFLIGPLIIKLVLLTPIEEGLKIEDNVFEKLLSFGCHGVFVKFY